MFDFAIFNKEGNIKALIEYDGIQHFIPIDYFGGLPYLQYLQICDNEKNNYCKKNNILLKRINYKELDNIEILIGDFL